MALAVPMHATSPPTKLSTLQMRCSWLHSSAQFSTWRSKLRRHKNQMDSNMKIHIHCFLNLNQRGGGSGNCARMRFNQPPLWVICVGRCVSPQLRAVATEKQIERAAWTVTSRSVVIQLYFKELPKKRVAASVRSETQTEETLQTHCRKS